MKLLHRRKEEPRNEANVRTGALAYLRVLEAKYRPSILPRSQLSSACTVHELGNEASLVTVWMAGEFYRQD